MVAFNALICAGNRRYWAVIDDALREAAFGRHVHVRLMMSRWTHTPKALYSYLYSLQDLNGHLPCAEYYDPKGTYAIATAQNLHLL